MRVGQGFSQPGKLPVQPVLECSVGIWHLQVFNISLEYYCQAIGKPEPRDH
jgi:hypothetical protein